MICLKHDSRVDWCHSGLPSHPTAFTCYELKYWNVLRTGLLPRLWLMHTFCQSGIISYPSLLALTYAVRWMMCVVCRIWGHPARRSGLATASCLLWRRWLSQSIPTTICESALERCSQIKALTSWTSRILVLFLFHAQYTTLHLTQAALRLNYTTVSLRYSNHFLSVCACDCVAGWITVFLTNHLRHDEYTIAYLFQ